MRRCKVLLVLFLGIALTKCSSSDDTLDSGTLFVDGSVFKIGTNTGARIYNDLLEDGTQRKIFTIIEKTSEGVEPNVIELDFNFEGAVFDGVYPIYSSNDYPINAANYVVGDYNTPTTYFGAGQVSGTIKVTNLGNKKYKLEFNNAIFSARDNPALTRTITGHCEPTFSY